MKIFKQKEFYGVKSDDGKTVFKANQIINKNDIEIEEDSFIILKGKELFYVKKDLTIQKIYDDNNLKYDSKYLEKIFYFKTSIGIVAFSKDLVKDECRILFETDSKIIQTSEYKECNEIISYRNKGKIYFYNLLEEKEIGNLNESKNFVKIGNITSLSSSNMGFSTIISQFYNLVKELIVIYRDDKKLSVFYKDRFLFDFVDSIKMPANINEITKKSQNLTLPLILKNGNESAVYNFATKDFILKFKKCFIEDKPYDDLFIETLEYKKINLYDMFFTKLNREPLEYFCSYLKTKFVTDKTSTKVFANLEDLKNNNFIFDFKDKKIIKVDSIYKTGKKQLYFLVLENNDGMITDENFQEKFLNVEVIGKYFLKQTGNKDQNFVWGKKEEFLIRLFLFEKGSRKVLVYSVDESENQIKLTRDDLNLNFKNTDMSTIFDNTLKYGFFSEEQIKEALKQIGQNITAYSFLQKVNAYQLFDEEKLLKIYEDVFYQDIKFGLEIDLKSRKSEFLSFGKDWSVIFGKLNKSLIKKHLTKENMNFLPQLKIWSK